ncbi:MAG: hypothetical protein R3Y40_06960 [Eubacteriales bacterium]
MVIKKGQWRLPILSRIAKSYLFFKIVIGWLALHEDEVYGAWNHAVRGIAFEKIRPL